MSKRQYPYLSDLKPARSKRNRPVPDSAPCIYCGDTSTPKFAATIQVSWFRGDDEIQKPVCKTCGKQAATLPSPAEFRARAFYQQLADGLFPEAVQHEAR